MPDLAYPSTFSNCFSETTGKRIIPDNGGNYDFRQSVAREEEVVTDALKWSVNGAFGHLREIIPFSVPDEKSRKEPFSIHGQTHKDKLVLKDMMEKYPSN